MKTHGSFDGDGARWQAVRVRDRRADGAFFFAVKTTGVYCRPSCRSRLPKRENVCFFSTFADAEGEGFRPCKRCRPNESKDAAPHREAILQACRELEHHPEVSTLGRLARGAGMSPSHFQRVFKRTIGVTPKQYGMGRRDGRFRERLRRGGSVTAAIYEAGFNSNSRAYENVNRRLGMPPSAYRRGGQDITVHYTCLESDLGWVLVAATDQGVCGLEFGASERVLRSRVAELFPKARRVENGATVKRYAKAVAAYLGDCSANLDLPLDLRGTAFQLRVWRALRDIPPGSVTTYGKVAASIGAPRSVRAVAHACAKNRVALGVPCHRVLRSDGGMGGYRWGEKRKRALLDKEKRAAVR